MASEILLESKEGGRVAVVTINRPQRRNACDFQAWTDMRAVFLELGADKNVRLIVLTGAGGHFCAGDDIKAFRSILPDSAAADRYRDRIQECYAAVQDLPVPVIAAISGACVGGGCSLALCCDFRVADGTARIGVPVARLGLMYPTVQLMRLTQLIGLSQARRWIYTGGLADSRQALAAGFLDEAGSGDPVAAALEFGRPMMDGAPLSIAGSKMQLNAIAAGRLDESRAMIEEITQRANNSEDYKNAAAAFAAEKIPKFEGR